MSVATKIASLTTSRNTIRNKMIAAKQAKATDKLETLASNLVINQGTDTEDATASAEDIISGKTAYAKGLKVTGTMDFATDDDIRDKVLNGRGIDLGDIPNIGAVSKTLNAGEVYDVPEGYHNGKGKVTANSLSSQTSGTATASDIFSAKTAYVNGIKLSGTMSDNGSVNIGLLAGGSYTIAKGYHDGTGKVTANSLASQTSGTATADDIFDGKTAWINGVQVTGTRSLATSQEISSIVASIFE